MKAIPLLLAGSLLLLGGCKTFGGHYELDAVDANGHKLNKKPFLAQGSGIYTVRNTLCTSYPKATVIIRDVDADQELAGESPHHCD